MKFTFTSIIALLLLFILNPENVFSQVQNEANISSSDMRNMLDSNQIPLHRATNVEGSPYMFDEFYEGVVELTNGHTTQPLQIRYNTHEQSIDFMSGNLAFNVEGENIESFHFTANGKEYTFIKGYDASRLSEDDFVEVVVDGEVKFLARHHTSFFEDSASYGSATKNNIYRSDVTYYVKVGDKSPERLRSLNKRRVMNNIDRFEDELEQYADQNNIDFSDKEDVARLIRYCNTLGE